MEAATVAVIRDDKVLLLKRSKKASSWRGYFNFAGGGVEQGEQLSEAAIRELKEETNLDVSPDQLQYLGFLTQGKLRVHFFITDQAKGEVKINDESSEFVWSPLSEIDNYLFIGNGKIEPEIVKRIEKYIRRRNVKR